MALPSFRVTELRRRENHASILAAWGFNEATGTSARDSTGRGNTLTVDAGMTWPAGRIAATCLGNGGSAGSAHASWNIANVNVTLMGWARPHDLTAGTSVPLFGIWDGTTIATSTEVAIFAQRSNFSTSNVLQGNVRVGGGLIAVNDTAPPTLNTWVHLALTFNGTILRLYKDAVEVATASITGSILPVSANFLVAPNPSNVDVDDIRIFSTALTAAEIANFKDVPVAAP
jgi:hypothetical protein